MFVLPLKATNKAGTCQMILFLSVQIQFIESECQPPLQWSRQTHTAISESHSVTTDQNPLGINTSTCQSFYAWKKLSKYEMKINTVGFPPVEGFAFLWVIKSFLFTIINVSEDRDSETPASFMSFQTCFFTQVHVHAALFHTMKLFICALKL